MHEFESRFAQWVTTNRWWLIVGMPIVILLAASGGRLITFDASYRAFFDEDNPDLIAYENIERIYTKTNNVLFLIAPSDGNVFTRKTLAAVKDLTDGAWQLTYSSRVDSITNFQHTKAHGDDLTVRDLVLAPASLSDDELAEIRDTALAEPLLAGRLISHDGHVTGVNVRTPLPGTNRAVEVPIIAAAAHAMAEDFRARHPDIPLLLAGEVMMNNAFPDAAQGDMRELIPVCVALMMIMMLLLLRNVTLTLSAMLIIAFSILAAMGLRGYSGWPLSVLSGSTPIIIMTVAVANAVHILVTIVNGMHQGLERRAAIEESLRVNLQPVFLASVTTMLGFMTLNAADSPPMRHIGNTVAAGVIISFILSVTFLPALLSVLPLRIRRAESQQDAMMTRFAQWVVAQQRRLMVVMGLTIIIIVAFAPMNQLNEDPVRFFDESFAFRRATDFMEANLTGAMMVNYSLQASEPGGVSDPQFLQEAEQFASWLRQQPEVDHVGILTDILKRLNKNLHGDVEAEYRLPEERDLAAQYLLLYEMSLPYGLDLNDQINIDKSSIRVSVTIRSAPMRSLLDFERRVQDWLATNTPSVTADPGSGIIFMFAAITQRNAMGMLKGASVALVLISGLLIFAFRSVKFGMISLIPNLAPAAMGFGIWAIFDGMVGLDLSLVVGMTLGIIVDDTVHFMSKYLRARRERGLPSAEAVVYAFSNVGRALVVTSIVLIVGFLVLSTSHFGLNSRMASLTAIVIGLALVVDFLFLPPVLIKLDRS